MGILSIVISLQGMLPFSNLGDLAIYLTLGLAIYIPICVQIIAGLPV